MNTLSKSVLSFFALYSQVVLGCEIYPLEIVRRALLFGPLITKTASATNQWAGRTTLASGSATVTVSTVAVNSDSVLNLTQQCAIPAAYTTRGQTSTISGDVSKTLSTTAVYSGQSIQATFQSETATSSAGSVMGMLRINSIVDRVSFAVSLTNSAAFGHEAGVINWAIPQAQPVGLKVNTISPGNFFTLGWADGAARPIDNTVMWEIKRAS